MTYVGLFPEHEDPVQLKHYALLFDHFVSIGMPFPRDMDIRSKGHMGSDRWFLFESGVFIQRKVDHLLKSPEFQPFLEEAKRIRESVSVDEIENGSDDQFLYWNSIDLRWTAAASPYLFPKQTAVPLGSMGIAVGGTQASVVDVVLRNLPVPSELVSWQDILEFRAEEESQRQIRRLRAWLSDLKNSNLTYPEVSDKIGYLMDEYRAHMKGAGMKHRFGVLRTVVTGTAALLENVANFKLRDIAEAPFKLIDARAELLEAEQKAHGRELAYIIRAQDRFGV